MSKSLAGTLVPSNLSTSHLTSTLRDAAELVVDATTSSAKAISAALPIPELAAGLPGMSPFVGSQRSHQRSTLVTRVVIVGAVVAAVCAAVVLYNKAQRRSPEVVEAR